MTHEFARALLDAGYMTSQDYLRICAENGWPHSKTPPAPADEAYDLGKKHMRDKLAVCANDPALATNYALGALTAICSHCFARHGPRYTYDLLQNMADQAASILIEREPRP